MNGPKHVREAKDYLADAPGDTAAAQVHATLALVALLVDVFGSRIQPRELIAEWAEATR